MKLNIIILSLLIILVSACLGSSDEVRTVQDTAEIQEPVEIQEVSIKIEFSEEKSIAEAAAFEGKTINAFIALQSAFNVEFEQFSFGKMITSIDGVASEENKNYWAMYVNGAYSMTGIDATELKDGDELSFRLEEIV